MGWATLAADLLRPRFLAWRVASWMRVHQARGLRGDRCSPPPHGHRRTASSGYQRNRFVAWIAPQSDTQGASYNVIQSQIAVGSGGMWGKGLFSGTQSQLGFLPERHTDFVFANVGEEMGFWGTSLILGLYMVLLWRIVAAARQARDRYGYLVCAGLASTLAFQLTLNVGMCVGLMPVAGVPLPLVSYGGSSLFVTLWTLGIVANIYARRYALL